MRRCRLIVVVGAVALVIAGAAWWLLSDRLTTEERRLVGTWRIVQPGRRSRTMILSPDRRCRVTAGLVTDQALGRWSAGDGVFKIDWEPNAARRLGRPVYRLVGMSVGPVDVGEVTAGGLTIDGQVWTRAGAL